MSTTVEVRSAMIVRESSRFGPCNLLGPLVDEAPTRYTYQRRHGSVAFAQRSPKVHLEPCRDCPDHPASRFGHLCDAS
jgi:hypothetical protein